MRGAHIEAVLFDAGNTLLHLDHAFIAGVLAEHGYHAAVEEVRIAEYAAKAAVDREFVPELFPVDVEGLVWADERPSYFATILSQLGISANAMASILPELQAHNRAASLWRVVEADTATVLGELRDRGFALAVISNADGRIEADLEQHGLRAYFSDVVDSHVVGVEKPDPAIFRLALDRVGTAADTAVYVGDMWSIDVLGARKAGLRPVLIDTLRRYPVAVDCPRIQRLSELLDLLPQQARRAPDR